MNLLQPIFLFADSQLLFFQDREPPAMGRIQSLLAEVHSDFARTKAAYLGASNGDLPEFYELFVAAMEGIGITDCRQIPASPSAEDRSFLDEAHLILLAGGDAERGARSFRQSGLHDRLVARYYEGALMIGVSAGAMLLGLNGLKSEGAAPDDHFETLRIVPWLIEPHGEPGWSRLHRVVPQAGLGARGLGLPRGAGAIHHPDGTLEPLRQPLVEVVRREIGLAQALLLPLGAVPDESAAPPHLRLLN